MFNQEFNQGTNPDMAAFIQKLMRGEGRGQQVNPNPGWTPQGMYGVNPMDMGGRQGPQSMEMFSPMGAMNAGDLNQTNAGRNTGQPMMQPAMPPAQPRQVGQPSQPPAKPPLSGVQRYVNKNRM